MESKGSITDPFKLAVSSQVAIEPKGIVGVVICVDEVRLERALGKHELKGRGC